MRTMADNKPSKLEKALDFKEKYEALISEAKEEALTSINEQIAELAKLGVNYELVEVGVAPKKFARAPRADGEKQQRVCKTCGEPGHNSRTCPNRPAA